MRGMGHQNNYDHPATINALTAAASCEGSVESTISWRRRTPETKLKLIRDTQAGGTAGRHDGRTAPTTPRRSRKPNGGGRQ